MKGTPIEASTLQRRTKAELIRLIQLQNKANHHVAAENQRLTKEAKFADQSKSVTIRELETEVDQLTERNNLLTSDLITVKADLATATETFELMREQSC